MVEEGNSRLLQGRKVSVHKRERNFVIFVRKCDKFGLILLPSS